MRGQRTSKMPGSLPKLKKRTERVLEIAPGWAEVHNNLGTTLCEQGKFKEAVDCYERGLALKPDVAKVHYNPGKVLKDMGYLTDPQRDTNRRWYLNPTTPRHIIVCPKAKDRTSTWRSRKPWTISESAPARSNICWGAARFAVRKSIMMKRAGKRLFDLFPMCLHQGCSFAFEAQAIHGRFPSSCLECRAQAAL